MTLSKKKNETIQNNDIGLMLLYKYT